MKSQKIKQVWLDYSTYLAKQSIPHEIEQFKKRLTAFFCPGPSYYYVFDFSSFQMSFVSEECLGILGLSSENATIDQILNRLHPDDVDFFSTCEAYVANFLFQTLKPEQILHYKVSYCFRLLAADGSYRLFLHQASGITLDDSGRLGKVLGVHTDISHITIKNHKKLSLFGLDGHDSYTRIDVYSDKPHTMIPKGPLLTKREVEVLRLLSEGASTEDVATELSISTGTVRKHRENMLRKTNAKNSIQLVSLAIRNGLI